MSIRPVLPLTLLATFIIAACSDTDHGTPSTGISSSGITAPAASASTPDKTTDPQVPDSISDDSFGTPDPNGSTRLERLGLRAVADQAQTLVAARYADAYLAVADELRDLTGNEALVSGSRDVSCPNGGSATVSRANAGAPGQPLARDYSFDGCAVDGTTLDGSLRQRETRSGKELSTRTELASIAEELSITGEDGRRATVTGTLVDRTERTRVPDCGIEPAVRHTREILFDRVALENTGDTLETVSYYLDELDGYDKSGDCTRSQVTTFKGEAAAMLGDGAGGRVAVTLSVRGELLGTPPDEGVTTLASSAADGSSLTITATDLGAALARFDLSSGQAISTTVDKFRFVP